MNGVQGVGSSNLLAPTKFLELSMAQGVVRRRRIAPTNFNDLSGLSLSITRFFLGL
jgi:hypothetical protein